MHKQSDITSSIKEFYEKCSYRITDFEIALESKEYQACSFKLNGRSIISRKAKITPKKMGQFVTFWKRTGNGPIEPFHENDNIDFFVVNTANGNHRGQFVFPKALLILKGIISTNKKEGKRAIRVYPPWDKLSSKQALKTQNWQQDYFLEIHEGIDNETLKELYADLFRLKNKKGLFDVCKLHK